MGRPDRSRSSDPDPPLWEWAVAALGAVVALYFGLAQASLVALPLLAIGGALVSLALLFTLAGGSESPLTLILAGIAVATASGFTYRADTKKVYIKRASEPQERQYPLTTTTPVAPGDTIRIGERFF